MAINRNKLPGIIFLVIGIALLFLINGQIPKGSGFQHGPRLFPIIVSVVMVICSLALLFEDFQITKKASDEELKDRRDEKYWSPDLKELLGVGIYFIMICGYVYILDKVSFILASLLFVTASLIFYKNRKWTSYVIVILLTISIYFIFTFLLKTRLP